jgi:hypothetical protein
MLCVSALIFALMPSFILVFFAEVLQGLTAGTVTPAIAAISLGASGSPSNVTSDWAQLSV